MTEKQADPADGSEIEVLGVIMEREDEVQC